MNPLFKSLIFSVATLALTSACSKNVHSLATESKAPAPGPSPAELKVVDSNPIQGHQFMTTKPLFYVEFSEDPAQFDANSFELHQDNAAGALVTVSSFSAVSSKKFKFSATTLTPGTTYVLVFKTGVRGTSGGALSTGSDIQFKTAQGWLDFDTNYLSIDKRYSWDFYIDSDGKPVFFHSTQSMPYKFEVGKYDKATGTMQSYGGTEDICPGTNCGWLPRMVINRDKATGTVTPYLFINNWGTPRIVKWDGAAWINLVGGASFKGSPYMTDADMTLDEKGNPVLTYPSQNEGGKPFVVRWRNNAWAYLGSSTTGLAATKIDYLQVRVANNGDVYFFGTDSVAKVPVFKRYINGNWEDLPTTGLPAGQHLGNRMILDKDEKPVVVFKRADAAGLGQMMVARFNGSAWDTIGNNISPTSDVSALRMILGYDGKIYISSMDFYSPKTQAYIKCYNGVGWESVGGAASEFDGRFPSYAQSVTGEHYLFYAESNSSNTTQDYRLRLRKFK